MAWSAAPAIQDSRPESRLSPPGSEAEAEVATLMLEIAAFNDLQPTAIDALQRRVLAAADARQPYHPGQAIRLRHAWAMRLQGPLRRPSAALALFGAIVIEATKLEDWQALAAAQTCCGDIFGDLGRYAESLAAYGAAEALCDRLGRPGDGAAIRHCRAEILYLLARPAEAMLEVEAAIGGFTAAANDDGVLAARLLRAKLLASVSRGDEALAELERAKRERPRAPESAAAAAMHLHEAAVHDRLERWAEALAAVERAAAWYAASADETELAQCRRIAGRLLACLGRFDASLESFDRARPRYEELGHVDFLIEIDQNRGHVLFGLNRPADAMAAYVAAGRGLRRLLRQDAERLGDATADSVRANYGSLLSGALQVAAASNRAEFVAAAYEVLQVFRDHRLLTTLALRSSMTSSADRAARQAIDVLQDRVREIRATIVDQSQVRSIGLVERKARAELRVAAAREISTLESELDRRIERLNWRTRVALGAVDPRPMVLADIQEALAPDAALFEYVADLDGVFAFAIRADACRFVSLGPLVEAESLLAACADALKRQGPHTRPIRDGPLVEAGRRWVAPLWRTLVDDDVNVVYVAADAAFDAIPFDILPIDVDAPGDGAERECLLDSVGVAYVPSGAFLRDAAASRSDSPKHRPTFLGVAFPTVTMPGGAAALEAAPFELADIAAAFAVGDDEIASLETLRRRAVVPDAPDTLEGVAFQILLDRAATPAGVEEGVKRRRPDVLHVACHGALDVGERGIGYLELAADARHGSDGRFDARRLASLGHAPEVLVLAACRPHDVTRPPPAARDDLVRAALFSGTRNVLAPTTTIGDGASAALWRVFYGRWLRDGRSRLSAFRDARRRLMNSGATLDAWVSWRFWGIDGP